MIVSNTFEARSDPCTTLQLGSTECVDNPFDIMLLSSINYSSTKENMDRV